MIANAKRPQPAGHLPKEAMRMPKRALATLTALFATTVLSLALMPIAQASAAEPWWQVLTGSHPTNMWEPTDSVQEFEIKENPGLGATIAIKVGGQTVGCLGTGLLSNYCPEPVGFPTEETAAELEATLESAFGTSAVDVSGGPVAVAPFRVTTPGSPPVSLVPYLAGITGTVKVTTISPGGSGRLALTLTNLGDAAVDGSVTPVKIVDELPEGVEAIGVEGFAGTEKTAIGLVECEIEAPDEVTCTFEGKLPPYEALEVEVLASLIGTPPAAGDPGKVTVSGGNAASASSPQTVEVSPEPAPFGIEKFSGVAEEEGGKPTSEAGRHPFQYTNTIQLNSGPFRSADRKDGVVQPGMPRNLHFPLPAGLVGNASNRPTCEMTDFIVETGGVNDCSANTAIGASAVTFVEKAQIGLGRVAVPVFNLTPARGEPARFGFTVLGNPVLIDTSVDPDDDYRIIAHITNTTQAVEFLSGTTSFWGTPGDPRHDNARGWNCVFYVDLGPCERPGGLNEAAFLRMPVSCSAPLDYDAEIEPWNVPLGSFIDRAPTFTGEPLHSCNRVPFDPSIASSPTSKLAENPSGLDFKLSMPNSGLLNSEGIAESQPKKVEVTLPEGVTLNPSAGEGLAVCSPAQYARETASSRPGEGCPEASKIGNVKISTPLIEEEVTGALYQATPYDNPSNSLLGLYMVARARERGIIVKQAGRVEPDPETGQLTTTFDNIPQQPFSSFDLHFREGGRAPLVTPPTCGKYDVTARFTPWSAQDPNNPAPNEVVTRTSSFMIERGVDGGACHPAATPPFKPSLIAGTTNNAAGSFSPFNVRLTRNDGEQEFTNFSIKLPPGVAGKLAGIPFCSDAQIALAVSRTGPHGGQEELDHPACPAASQVGRTLAGAGAGSILTYAPGKIYLAGPYHGAPISFVSITSGVVGPFDIGTVAVRLAIKVNPETGEVFLDSTGSDPIPHIVKGVVLHLRDIRAYTDRPEFTFNPTSCKRTSTAATVLGSGLDFVSPSDDNPFVSTSPFQAADCAALPFKPKLSLKLQGGTRRGAHPALKAFLRMNGFGEAGVARARVTLPKSEFIENAHFNTICTRVQFKQLGGNGEACPAGSIYGRARAKSPILSDPLEGPIFLRSSEHQLPDLVASLRGQEINVHLVGHVDSVKGQLRNTFETVPDAPVEWASFSFQGQKKGLFVNSTNLCKEVHKAKVEFDGQNGKSYDYGAPLKVKCAKAGKARPHPRG